MSAIVLFRIDERLVHGQVVTAWVGHTRARKLLVVDDASAGDPLISSVLKMACPPGLSMQIATVAEAVTSLANAHDDDAIMLIVRNPVAALALLANRLAVLPQEINMGNAGNAPGRKKLTATVYLDEANQKALAAITALGHTVYFQTVPADSRYSWEKVTGQ